MYKKLGILGGMGPLATCRLYSGIVEGTPAKRDQDHIDMVILNACYVPDRTEAILHGGNSPLPYLLGALKTLEAAGCDVVAIPCNTSHYFYDELQKGCGMDILNMIDLTAEKLENNGISKAFLMATEGTVKTGIYQKYFSKRNIEIIPPSDAETAEMMKVIYEVKAGKSPDLEKLLGIARRRGELFVIGCTELSVLNFGDMASIDAMEVLKEKILELFGVQKK